MILDQISKIKQISGGWEL